MKPINPKSLHEILAPLDIPDGLIYVSSPVLSVLNIGNLQLEYLQLERARLALMWAGWEAVESDIRTVLVRGEHTDLEFLKFIQASGVGSEEFESLARFNTSRKLSIT